MESADEKNFCVVICTYKRPATLMKLIGDLLLQTAKPEKLIIVDGDPGSGEVKRHLKELGVWPGLNFFYIGSRYANLAYQRYLGWLAARRHKTRHLVYFDDDLRLLDADILETLVVKLARDGLAGLTAETLTGSPERFADYEILREQREGKMDFFSRFGMRFGSGGSLTPGSLSPSGTRIQLPEGQAAVDTVWLYGRVMAYDLRYLTQECFSEDLFALTHVRCGLGEDTFLSHRVAAKGRLQLLRGLKILHPDDDLPNSYPIRSYSFGYASAYSRRLLNDDYRFPREPFWKDRAALLYAYLGNVLVALARFLFSPSLQRINFLRGYFMGALKGLFVKPTARNLSPGIAWFKDADSDLLAGESLN